MQIGSKCGSCFLSCTGSQINWLCFFFLAVWRSLTSSSGIFSSSISLHLIWFIQMCSAQFSQRCFFLSNNNQFLPDALQLHDKGHSLHLRAQRFPFHWFDAIDEIEINDCVDCVDCDIDKNMNTNPSLKCNGTDSAQTKAIIVISFPLEFHHLRVWVFDAGWRRTSSSSLSKTPDCLCRARTLFVANRRKTLK